MSDVYVVVWVDRHTDPTVHVFENADIAIEWAKAQARDNDRHDELDETLTGPMSADGWLYHGSYSSEGDFLYVVKRTIRKTADVQGES